MYLNEEIKRRRFEQTLEKVMDALFYFMLGGAVGVILSCYFLT